MKTIKQAKQVEQRLREGISIATERDIYSGFIPVAKLSANTIASLITELEAAQTRLAGLEKFMDSTADDGLILDSTQKSYIAAFPEQYNAAIAAAGDK